jgi:hypothetical protein
MNELDHLSYSSIALYLSCPEAWRRKYIAGEPTYSSPALVFGSAMHNTVEKHICSDEDLLSLWPGMWSKALEGQEVIWGMDTPEQHFNEGVRILSDAQIQYNLAALKPGRNGEDYLIEQKVELRVPGVPVPIVGYIDVITEDGVPGDFKTSSKSWSSDRAAGELQPLFYLAALNQAGKSVAGWKFRHYTIVKTKQPKFQTFEHSHKPAELFFLFEMIQRVWTAIKREVFPLNPSGWKCDPQYCDFWSNCRGKYV